MSKWIYSTCGAPMTFKFYRPHGDGKQTIGMLIPLTDPKTGADLVVNIAGGAYVISYSGGKASRVAVTEVTDEELTLLESHPSFQNMKKRGFFTVHDESRPVYDSKGIPLDMVKHDDTAQIGDGDHSKGPSADHRLAHVGTRAATGQSDMFKGEKPIVDDEF